MRPLENDLMDHSEEAVPAATFVTTQSPLESLEVNPSSTLQLVDIAECVAPDSSVFNKSASLNTLAAWDSPLSASLDVTPIELDVTPLNTPDQLPQDEALSVVALDIQQALSEDASPAAPPLSLLDAPLEAIPQATDAPVLDPFASWVRPYRLPNKPPLPLRKRHPWPTHRSCQRLP